ncbi:MAG TPA: ATP-binding protein [Anaeromyxobacteraceae bacterium]|nr:ATP-binding protein [Anaeromyxobacteraceae bacterium]
MSDAETLGTGLHGLRGRHLLEVGAPVAVAAVAVAWWAGGPTLAAVLALAAAAAASGAAWAFAARLERGNGAPGATSGRPPGASAEPGAQLSASDSDKASLAAAARAAREEAERASRARDELVAVVSHELRTPLNAVLGWARLLRMGKLDAAGTARAIEAVERSATAQAQIVDDLLDVSRMVRGQLLLDVRPVDLVPVIEAAIAAVRPAAAARNTEIAAVLVPPAGVVMGDPGRLQQVVWNLLSNAIKFTPPGGRVEVRLEPEGGEVAIRVRDTGAGIDPAFLPHVFERFRQADASSTRVHGGLGLGLAIVRHLVEAHGGTVGAESDGPGKGAAFTVRLLAGAPHQRTALPDAARPAPVLPVDERPLASLLALRVLVVDDDPDTLEVVGQVLAAAGAHVVPARSAGEALEAIEVSRPDVLVSDIGMPGEDGYALIRKVRGLAPEHGGRVPAAALTAYTHAEDRREALLAGYQLYLPKPIEPSELTAAIARLAGRLN